MIEMFLTDKWSEWEPWGSCDEEDGNQIRRRYCRYDGNALSCVGPYIEERPWRPCCGTGTFFVLRKQKKFKTAFHYLIIWKCSS